MTPAPEERSGRPDGGATFGPPLPYMPLQTTSTARKAHGLIQDYLGPDHKVIDMQRFYPALVSALKSAREQGQADAFGPLGGVSNLNKG